METDIKVIFFSVLHDQLTTAELMDYWMFQISDVRKALKSLEQHGLISADVTVTEKGQSLQAFLWAHTDLSIAEAFKVSDRRVKTVARRELKKMGRGNLSVWNDEEVYREVYR